MLIVKTEKCPLDTYPHGVYSGVRESHTQQRYKSEVFMNNSTGEEISSVEQNVNNSSGSYPCCSGKIKVRESSEKTELMNRLRRIEGQVRGLEGMLERNAYCTDILMQVSAVTSALNSFSKQLLASHIKTCVADNIRSGNDEVIDELVTALQKLMK